MSGKNKTATVIRWIARIWGAISLLFLLFMVGAHILGALSGTDQGGGFGSASEVISFLFFPVSTLIGLSLAWKWEGIGGLIIVLGMVAFHIIRPDLIFDPIIDGLAVPGLFYVAYSYLTRE